MRRWWGKTSHKKGCNIQLPAPFDASVSLGYNARMTEAKMTGSNGMALVAELKNKFVMPR